MVWGKASGVSELCSHCCPILQIEDLSQQVHKAAAEKFKVPSESSALVPELAPGPRVRPECEEQEEEDEEVRPRGSQHLTGGRIRAGWDSAWAAPCSRASGS